MTRSFLAGEAVWIELSTSEPESAERCDRQDTQRHDDAATATSDGRASGLA